MDELAARWQLGWASESHRVGPKGYIHGWIFVGVPVLGQRVFHPHLGHGTVHGSASGRVDVHFHKTGETHRFEVRRDPGPSHFERMSDQQVASHLGDGTGEAFTHALAELDRRDRMERESKIRSLYAQRPATRGQADKLYRSLVDAGENPEDAYAHAHGRSTENLRRQAITAQLREQGYTGTSFDTVTRTAFRDEQQRMAIDAERATNGNMLSKSGKVAGIDPWTLFGGTEAAARKYASTELRQYWDTHGRPTVREFQQRLLGHGGLIGAPSGGDFVK